MATVILKPEQKKREFAQSPRIFTSQISRIKGNYKAGDIVSVESSRNEFIGRGFINPGCNIPVRLLTCHNEPVNKEFLFHRIKQAIDYRRKIISEDTNVYRLIFSESDFLPGLIADVYGEYIVLQILTLGMESIKDIIVEILKELMNPKGIYLRNDTPVRLSESLPLEKKAVLGRFPTKQRVQENGIPFVVDMENGQKTGFFIDRRDNRALLRQIVKGKTVLDCFCFSGAFSVYAAYYQASKVIGIDVSAYALKSAVANMKANKIHRKHYEFREDDVFNSLRRMCKNKDSFDVVILDPPSFVSSKAKLENGLRGYREINLRALRLLKKGGVLVSLNSSYLVNDGLFKQIIYESAEKEKKKLRVIKWGEQASDHPRFFNLNDTSYMKCLVAEVL